MVESNVVSAQEFPKYHDLGLGRGVNVTDPQMWRNKSHFQIRHVCDDLSNIIGTEECGTKDKYEKEVSTVATQQLEIKLSLDEPSGRFRIGMDAQNSQSTSLTTKIAGTEIRTRTISFRVDCSDLPVYNTPEDPRNEMPTHQNDESGESLETSLYSWILERICYRERETRQTPHPLVPGSDEETDGPPSNSKDLTKLAHYLHEFRCQSESGTEESKKISKEKLKAVAKDCKVFVKDLGITHYVSAIELGALKYSILTTSCHQEKTGAGAQMGAGKMAEGGISGMVGKQWFKKAKEEQTIGRLKKDETVACEAVIGFQIQPIHKLVRLPLLQIALQKAMTQYIEYKADKSVGPFRISCEINKTTIYWIANKDHTNVVGTECEDEASLFFIVPTEDAHHPSEFFITYYEKREFDETDPFMKLQIKKSKQPCYLATDSNVFGSSSGPLDLRSTVLVRQARFALHSRVQPSFTFMMCQSIPVTVSSWIEGEKFYVNCSRRSFKIDGYIAMKKGTDSTYKTVTVPTMKDHRESTDIGMLFCLSKYKPPPPPTSAESEGLPPPTTEAGGPPPPTTEAGGPPPPTTDHEAGGPPPSPTTAAGGPPPPTTNEAGGLSSTKSSKPHISRSTSLLRAVVNPFSYSGQYQLIFGDD